MESVRFSISILKIPFISLLIFSGQLRLDRHAIPILQLNSLFLSKWKSLIEEKQKGAFPNENALLTTLYKLYVIQFISFHI